MIFGKNNASKFPEINQLWIWTFKEINWIRVVSFLSLHLWWREKWNEQKNNNQKQKKRRSKTKHLRINKCTFKKRNSMQSRTIWNTRTFSHFDLAELLRRKICITIPVKFTSSGQKLFKINQLCWRHHTYCIILQLRFCKA